MVCIAICRLLPQGRCGERCCKLSTTTRVSRRRSLLAVVKSTRQLAVTNEKDVMRRGLPPVIAREIVMMRRWYHNWVRDCDDEPAAGIMTWLVVGDRLRKTSRKNSMKSCLKISVSRVLGRRQRCTCLM